MKDSKEQKTANKKVKKHNLSLVWKNDNPPAKNTCRLEFIGELAPSSNGSVLLIKNLPWLEKEKKDESNE
jgi:hypothetical protein